MKKNLKKNLTRCEALKNPCAIRRGSSWKGLSPIQHDKEFCEFQEMVYGLRAFFVLMRTYHYTYKCNTLKEIIFRYAPITENNTLAYIAFVLKYFREKLTLQVEEYDVFLKSYDFVSEDLVINVWFNRQSPCMLLRLLCMAVCELESRYIVDDEMIDKAIKLL